MSKTKAVKPAKKIVGKTRVAIDPVTEIDNAQELVNKTTEKKTKTSYHLFLKVNGLTSNRDTDDLKSVILSLKPVQVYTSLHLIVSKGKASLSRYYPTVGQVNIFFRQGLDNFIMNATRILK